MKERAFIFSLSFFLFSCFYIFFSSPFSRLWSSSSSFLFIYFHLFSSKYSFPLKFLFLNSFLLIFFSLFLTIVGSISIYTPLCFFFSLYLSSPLLHPSILSFFFHFFFNLITLSLSCLKRGQNLVFILVPLSLVDYHVSLICLVFNRLVTYKIIVFI